MMRPHGIVQHPGDQQRVNRLLTAWARRHPERYEASVTQVLSVSVGRN